MNPITEKGLMKLKSELAELKKEFDSLPEIIGEARDRGDLKENAEYHAARERQGMLRAMMSKLNGDIITSQIIDPFKLPKDLVTFGKEVKLINLKDEQEETYIIVGNAEANMEENKISISSQVAKGLIGKKMKEEVIITVPSGDKHYRIESISYMK